MLVRKVVQSQVLPMAPPFLSGCQKITCIYFEIMLPDSLFYINIISIYYGELRKYRRV